GGYANPECRIHNTVISPLRHGRHIIGSGGGDRTHDLTGMNRTLSPAELRRHVAPQAGFEPATDRLTADCSTTELLWNYLIYTSISYNIKSCAYDVVRLFSDA